MISTIKFLCLGHNWGYLGASLSAYDFALDWCVTIGKPMQPGNDRVKSNQQYFKSKYQKLWPQKYFPEQKKIKTSFHFA